MAKFFEKEIDAITRHDFFPFFSCLRSRMRCQRTVACGCLHSSLGLWLKFESVDSVEQGRSRERGTESFPTAKSNRIKRDGPNA